MFRDREAITCMTGVKEGALAWGQEICIYFMYLVANDVVENNLKYFEGEKESNAVKKNASHVAFHWPANQMTVRLKYFIFSSLG